jgi:hypothetical protein
VIVAAAAETPAREVFPVNPARRWDGAQAENGYRPAAEFPSRALMPATGADASAKTAGLALPR